MRRAKQLEAQEQAAAKKRAFQQEAPPGAGLGFARPPQQRTQQQQQQRPQLPWQQQAPGPQGQVQEYHQGLPPNHHQMQQQHQQVPFMQQQMMQQQPPQAMGLVPAGFGSPHQPAPGVQGIVHQGRWSRRG